jgi:uncharacterized membrane protein
VNARALGYAAWAGLVVLHAAWYLWLAPPQSGSPWLALALTVVPLLLPLAALRRSAQRALLWVGILALFYFCHGVVAAWGEPQVRALAWVEIALCVALIGVLGWESRQYKRPGRSS